MLHGLQRRSSRVSVRGPIPNFSSMNAAGPREREAGLGQADLNSDGLGTEDGHCNAGALLSSSSEGSDPENPEIQDSLIMRDWCVHAVNVEPERNAAFWNFKPQRLTAACGYRAEVLAVAQDLH